MNIFSSKQWTLKTLEIHDNSLQITMFINLYQNIFDSNLWVEMDYLKNETLSQFFFYDFFKFKKAYICHQNVM